MTILLKTGFNCIFIFDIIIKFKLLLVLTDQQLGPFSPPSHRRPWTPCSAQLPSLVLVSANIFQLLCRYRRFCCCLTSGLTSTLSSVHTGQTPAGGAEEEKRSTSSSHHFHRPEWDARWMFFFFPSPSGREGLQSAPWGSSLYSSHPSLHSLPVYSTCHLPSLPWRRLHMLPTEGGTREEEEVRTRVEKRRGGKGRGEERRGGEEGGGLQGEVRRRIRGKKMSLQLIEAHAEPWIFYFFQSKIKFIHLFCGKKYRGSAGNCGRRNSTILFYFSLSLRILRPLIFHLRWGWLGERGKFSLTNQPESVSLVPNDITRTRWRCLHSEYSTSIF